MKLAGAIVAASLAVATTAKAPEGVATGASNVHARDYIGPAACGECHPDEYARWSGSLHRVMNQRADPQAIIGDFAHVTLAYAGGTATFDRASHRPSATASGTLLDDYTMTVAKDARTIRYRVTRTIGVRGLQEYVGIADGSATEVRLPFAWWPRRGGWFPQPYFDPWLGDEANFDAYAPISDPWAKRCPWCHSTYPFEQRVARSSGPQHLGHGLEQFYRGEPGDDQLRVEQQVTTGISCESCHLGGRAHQGGAPIHLVPIGVSPTRGAPVATRFADERRDAAIVNTVCAQCHSGPSPRLADGTALRNSSEALDLAASPCTGIKCTDCHDPHRAVSDEARAIAACTSCHPKLAEPAAARAHAGHDGASCLDCHMPRVVQGLDHFVRTHRISSPTDPAMLASAPNACNLCHLDRSLAWTAAELQRGWEIHLPPYDDDRSAGETWLASPQPAIRLIASAAYGKLGRSSLPRLLDGLADPLAYVRTWTMFAIEDALGRRLREDELDPRAPAQVRAKQLTRLRQTWGQLGP